MVGESCSDGFGYFGIRETVAITINHLVYFFVVDLIGIDPEIDAERLRSTVIVHVHG